LGELADGGLTDFLISAVLLVCSVLGLFVGFLQVIQELEDAIDSIMSLGSGL